MKLLSRFYLVLIHFLTGRSLVFSGASLDSRAAAANNARWSGKDGVKVEAGGGGGKGGGGEMVSLSNPQLKILAFDEDYDFNLPPKPEGGGPVDVDVSLNLRNILQVPK